MSSRTRTLAWTCSLALAAVLGGCRTASTPAFDEQRAFDDLVSQVSFGPRNPGSPGHAKCRDWLVERLRAAGATRTVA